MSRLADQFLVDSYAEQYGMEHPRESSETCPNCGKKFSVFMTYQEPGCRELEEERCPYCSYICNSSFEWDYSTSKLPEEEHQ